MTELKTFDEVMQTVQSQGCNCRKDVRDEAIKWAKKIKSDELGEEYIPYKEGDSLFFGDWIKHFFGIKKEELK